LSRNILARFAEGRGDLVAVLGRETDFGQINTDAGDDLIFTPDGHGQTDHVFG
jgi:hypothetical protein